MRQDGLFQRIRVLPGVVDDFQLLSMGQDILSLGLASAFENVVMHSVTLLKGFAGLIRVLGSGGSFFFLIIRKLLLKRFANHIEHSVLLLFVHSIDDVGHSLFVRIFVLVFRFSGSFRFLFFLVHSGFLRMLKLTALIKADGTIVNLSGHPVFIGVRNNFLDKSTRISASEDETYFSNHAMNYIRTNLLKLIGHNRHAINVAILNHLLCTLRFRIAIKDAIGPDALRTILKQRMTQNIVRVIVLMIPDQRNFSTTVIFKSIFTNCSTISTQDVVHGRPTRKIVLKFRHFDCFPPPDYFPLRYSDSHYRRQDPALFVFVQFLQPTD